MQTECQPKMRETVFRAAGRRFSARRGFTLVEILVVIAIISILAALATPALMRSLDNAKQTRIKVELDQLDLALRSYKDKYGSYPPCNLVFVAAAGPPNAQTIQHVARIFPRYDMGAGYANLTADLKAAGIDYQNFRPDQALVFWLRGFGPDPTHPFVDLLDRQLTSGTPGAKVQRTPLLEFDATRLAVAQSPISPPTVSLPSYFPAAKALSVTPSVVATQPFSTWNGGGVPYLYWASTRITTVANSCEYGILPSTTASTLVVPNYFNSGSTSPNVTPFPNAGVAVPYVLEADNNPTPDANDPYANADSFQIISAGLDGLYGSSTAPPVPLPPPSGNPTITTRLYPIGFGYDTSSNMADDDNVTNFCNKPRLGDAKP